MSNWRDLLKSQQEELQKTNEVFSKGVEEFKLSEDIERILRKPLPTTFVPSKVSNPVHVPQKIDRYNYLPPDEREDAVENAVDNVAEDDEPKISLLKKKTISGNNLSTTTTSRPNSRSMSSRSVPRKDSIGKKDPSIESMEERNQLSLTDMDSTPSLILTGAPETNKKYNDARIKLLQQQVKDGTEIRLHLNEKISELERLLKEEKEENKKMKKRIQLLELDNRKAINSGSSKTGSNSTTLGGKGTATGTTSATATIGNMPIEASIELDRLREEVNKLQNDLQTAERVIKQNEANTKNKDTQLKRAVETINRLKAQVGELQEANKPSGPSSLQDDNRAKLESAEMRIRVLEKQRTEIINAFRKQLKLIDLLKRQKVHIEAMQLLNFTEEEFIKTLDWNI